MGLAAGRLDRRIRIERFTVTRDDFNAPSEAWATLTTVWASVRQFTGYERNLADQVQGHAATVFTIRHSSTVADVNPKDRVVYDGRTFNIEAVAEIGRREGLALSCIARVDP